MSKRTLTDADIKLLREVFYDKQEAEEKMRQVVKEEVSHLPDREEFLNETLKIYSKQEDLETEKDLLSHRVSIHSDQIETISKKLKISFEN